MKKATFTLMFLLATSVAMEPLWAQSGRQNPKAGASDSGKATAAENQADTESDDEYLSAEEEVWHDAPEPLGQAQDRPSWYGSASTPANPSTRAASVSGSDNTDDSERDNTDDEESTQVNQGALPHNPGSRSWSQLGSDCIGYGCAVARRVAKPVYNFYNRFTTTQEERNASLLEAAVNGDLARVELLLEAGAHVNAPDRDGRTPLHWAARYGHIEVCDLLIKAGANVNARDGEGLTPLHTAIYYQKEALCQLLLENGANPNALNRNDSTPLHLAAENGNIRLCQLLLENGANPNTLDRSGDRPLLAAAEAGRVNICELLINHEADVNATDIYGNTPLHIAAQEREFAVCKLLIEAGANANAQNGNGGTPLDVAEEIGGDFHAVFNAAVEARKRVGQRTKAALRGTDPVDEDDEVSEERSQPSAGSVHSMFATTQGIDRGPELATTPPVDNNSGASVLSTEDPLSSTASVHSMPAPLSEVAAPPQPADDGQMPVATVPGVSTTQPATANGDWSDLELDLDGLP